MNYIEKFCSDNNLVRGEPFNVFRKSGLGVFINNPYFFDLGWNLYSKVTRTQDTDILAHLLKGDFIFEKIKEEDDE